MKAKARRSAGSSFARRRTGLRSRGLAPRAHPGAAALFYDYMLTDGQRFYTEATPRAVKDEPSATLVRGLSRGSRR